ncbi:protein MODIFYING WALL LIGNIN-1-like [Zingiber officinale]|uniref:protein MODIFYING WALL LIGNIN-1-like n=1 Tax=Zingiber officinale TaxID=94328 RepID=UPI001C4AC32E|nr:protein MODIFYING WALL LIGNIN-1-like [Zingiber officinale]
MERKVVAVCVAVGLLGFLSAALAFAAEATRIKASDVEQTRQFRCTYPKSPALALGLLSAFALIVAQVIINTVAGCICCTKHPRPSGNNWMVALICFITSWVSFVLAFLLLLTGVALNDRRTLERRYFDNDECYVVKPGVFAGGAVSSFTSVALAIVYYVALSSKNAQTGSSRQNQGIVMGYPQVAPTQATPVFVHEDTYNRQQFP